MATSSLTVPVRTYKIGATTAQRALPSTQTYSHVDVSVDFSGWTSPATTLVEIKIEFSIDGGTTWQTLMAFTENQPPPYLSKAGPISVVTGSWDTPAALDPTNVQGTVTVSGAPVTIGPITLNAS